MFGGSKETTTTSKTEIPKWVEDLQKEYGAELGWLRDEAKAAIEGGAGGVPLRPEQWGEAEGIIRDTGGDYLSGIRDQLGRLGRDYEDPYLEDVVGTTLAGMDRQAARERLAREGRAAAVGGTSNTRAAVADALAGQLHGMNRAEMEAKLRSDAKRYGDEMTMEDIAASRGLLEGLLGGGMKVGGALGSIGEREFDYETQKANEEKDRLSWLGSMFGQANPLGVGAGTGTTTQTTAQPGPSTFSQILGAGAQVAGAFLGLSDEEAKEKIVPMEVGLDALRDVTPATYEYKAGMPTTKKGRTAGLMAQQLEHIPGAVEFGSDGYRRVDPYPVLATVVQAVKELDARTKE